MPKKSPPTYSTIALVVDDKALAAWQSIAERAGMTLEEWIADACADACTEAMWSPTESARLAAALGKLRGKATRTKVAQRATRAKRGAR